MSEDEERVLRVARDAVQDITDANNRRKYPAVVYLAMLNAATDKIVHEISEHDEFENTEKWESLKAASQKVFEKMGISFLWHEIREMEAEE